MSRRKWDHLFLMIPSRQIVLQSIVERRQILQQGKRFIRRARRHQGTTLLAGFFLKKYDETLHVVALVVLTTEFDIQRNHPNERCESTPADILLIECLFLLESLSKGF